MAAGRTAPAHQQQPALPDTWLLLVGSQLGPARAPAYASAYLTRSAAGAWGVGRLPALPAQVQAAQTELTRARRLNPDIMRQTVLETLLPALPDMYFLLVRQQPAGDEWQAHPVPALAALPPTEFMVRLATALNAPPDVEGDPAAEYDEPAPPARSRRAHYLGVRLVQAAVPERQNANLVSARHVPAQPQQGPRLAPAVTFSLTLSSTLPCATTCC